MREETHIRDTVAAYPFILAKQRDLIADNAFIVFNSITGAAASGKPYPFLPNTTIERRRVKAISISSVLVVGSADESDDNPAIQINGTYYKIPSVTQIIDWYLVLKRKNGDVLFNNMPLSRLVFTPFTSSSPGNLLATDLTGISLTDSFVMNKGAPAMASLPWCFMFQFYYERS